MNFRFANRFQPLALNVCLAWRSGKIFRFETLAAWALAPVLVIKPWLAPKRLIQKLCWNAALVSVLFAPRGFADSALPLLGGFDADRIEAVYPPTDIQSIGELSKLVFRLRSIDPKFLEAELPADEQAEPPKIGDAIRTEGSITAIAQLKVPERLVGFLEIERLQVIDIESRRGATRVITAKLPHEANVGDRISGVGVVIEPKQTPPSKAANDRNTRSPDLAPLVVATPSLRWYPESAVSVGWKMLGREGVDASLLANVSARNQLPLMAEDGDAFYSMLAAAHRINGRENVASPKRVKPVSLLSNPADYSGDWIRMPLETVQVTRIAVTQRLRQQQLGSDHYYQIDAVGDLGNVVVQIRRPKGDDGPPARFENRYPVSVVVRELPEFLSRQIRDQEQSDAMIADIRVPITIDAFFFRLWSYSTDFMTQYGGTDQFGPLMVAATIESRQQTDDDPVGVGIIGTIAAFSIFAAIIAIWFWNHTQAKRDQHVHDQRSQREAEQIQLPGEATIE